MDGQNQPRVTEHDFNNFAEGLQTLVEKLNVQRQRNKKLAAAREAATRHLRDFLGELNKEESKEK